ncbi:MAG: hypothetical protein HQ580_16275 [Planctomycetes bacterium]|nr:hypothetical protein [Planctomycetota bacterium]
MNIFLVIFGTIVGIVAAFFGIYRGLIAWKKWKIERSVIQFKQIRKDIKEKRASLRRAALKLSPIKSIHLNINDDVPLLAKETWLPQKPIPLENVELKVEQDPGVKIGLSTQKLPSYAGGKYKKYSSAIEDLDKPKLFVKRNQYRLLRIDDTSLTFSLKLHSYFDKINYGEYLVYELAHQNRKRTWIQGYSNRDLLLKQLQEPADYVILCGVTTLTIIHDGEDLRIIMHLRGQNETAYAMGTYHAIPAGEFQPSSLATVSVEEDFNLWKNIMREYAEEIGLMEEYDGNNAVPFNYQVEPFISIEDERRKNNIRPFYLGTGLDPITFQGEILTAVVFKEETFNKIFPKVLTKNLEGIIITDKDKWGRQFTQEEYDSYREANTLAAGEAVLNIAWKNRQFFKECFD